MSKQYFRAGRERRCLVCGSVKPKCCTEKVTDKTGQHTFTRHYCYYTHAKLHTWHGDFFCTGEPAPSSGSIWHKFVERADADILYPECPICKSRASGCQTKEDGAVFCTKSWWRKGDVVDAYRCLGVGENKRGPWALFRKTTGLPKTSPVSSTESLVMTARERDKHYRQLLGSLTLDEVDRLDLTRRGLSAVQIDRFQYRSVISWQPLSSPTPSALPGVSRKGQNLLNEQPGYLVPLFDVEKRIVALQMRCREKSEGGRYRWLSARGNYRLNDEPPLSVIKPKNTDFAMIGLAEGVGAKPQIISTRLNIPVIGAAGGNWAGSPHTLRRSLATLSSNTKTPVVLFVDAGGLVNRHICGHISAVYRLLSDWGYSVHFAWWGQLFKDTALDGDEYAGILDGSLGGVALVEPKEWLNRAYRWLMPFALARKLWTSTKETTKTKQVSQPSSSAASNNPPVTKRQEWIALSVPQGDRDAQRTIKVLGGRWNGDEKVWQARADNLSPFRRWLPRQAAIELRPPVSLLCWLPSFGCAYCGNKQAVAFTLATYHLVDHAQFNNAKHFKGLSLLHTIIKMPDDLKTLLYEATGGLFYENTRSTGRKQYFSHCDKCGHGLGRNSIGMPTTLYLPESIPEARDYWLSPLPLSASVRLEASYFSSSLPGVEGKRVRLIENYAEQLQPQ